MLEATLYDAIRSLYARKEALDQAIVALERMLQVRQDALAETKLRRGKSVAAGCSPE